MNLHSFLQEISQKDGVSGYEDALGSFLAGAFSPLVDEVKKDNLGNCFFYKRGRGEDPPRVMLCAHMDEIGLMVTMMDEKGFLKFTSLGGFDPRTLPGQEVTLYGREPVYGLIGFKPAHLQKEKEKGKAVKMEDLFIDTGLPKEELREKVPVGTVAAIRRNFLSLQGECRAGKALDDRAGVAVLWQCATELARLRHRAEVFMVASVQEEVGTRGAVVSTFGIAPDLGIAIDVCHGSFPGAAEHEVSPLGKGPVITYGPNIHPRIAEKLHETAREYQLPVQKDFSPGPTGTDARAIQVSLEGVPAGLLSIPLRYMHTSVELLDLEDIRSAGRLLAYFIADLSRSFVEGLSCF
ncbi:MAG: M42 family metallopeptidase [Firmicutes bacterium]|nr:M42 family metallopeptidase [Bacillota bacterium]